MPSRWRKNTSGVLSITGWAFVFMLGGFFIFPYLLHEGMFFDGMFYSAIGRNLSLGDGTFWRPYCNELSNPFYSHLPLAFGMLSQFYYLFGDTLYTPKLYNLFIGLLICLGICALWVKVDEKNTYIRWWPLVFFLLTPTVANSIRNTMLENTVLMFTLFSIRWMWDAMEHTKGNLLRLLAAGFFIYLAFLTKGIVALFPLVFPLLYAVSHKGMVKRSVIYTAFLCILFISLWACTLWFIPASRPYFHYYFSSTVGLAVAGKADLNPYGYFFVPGQIGLEILPYVVLSVPAFIFYRKKAISVNYRNLLTLVCIALSASLPLMVSAKQNGQYLLPSITFFTLAFSLFMQPMVLRFTSWLQNKRAVIILPLLFVLTGIIYPLIYDTYKEHDADLVADCKELDKQLPDKIIISADGSLANNWRTVAFMVRICRIVPSDREPSGYFLTTRNTPVDTVGFKKMQADLVLFDLYKKTGS